MKYMKYENILVKQCKKEKKKIKSIYKNEI